MLAAWIGNRVIGWALYALDVEVGDAVRLVILVVLWAAAWIGMRAWWSNPARQQQRQALAAADSLVGRLRQLLLWFALVVVASGGVVVALDSERDGSDGQRSASIVGGAVVAAGLLCVLMVWRLRRAPLTDASTPESTAASLRVRVFLQLVWSMFPVLAGFGAFVVMGDAPAWLYFVGAVCSLVALGFTVTSLPRDHDAEVA